MSRAT